MEAALVERMKYTDHASVVGSTSLRRRVGPCLGIWFICGTSGLIAPEMIESTGSRPVFVYGEQSETPLATQSIARRTADLLDNFGLTKVQLAKMLGVTRPTLDKWLNGEVVSLLSRNRERLGELERVLNSASHEVPLGHLGAVLRNTNDPDVYQASEVLRAPKLRQQDAIAALVSLKYRLAGKAASRSLDDFLRDSPVLG